MKKYLLLLGTCALFFLIGTSTSQDDPSLLYEADVILEGDNLIFTSNEEIAIDRALVFILDDSDEILDRESYSLPSYSLAAMATDTLALSSFMSLDSMPFPTTRAPSYFSLNFFFEGASYIVERTF